MQKARTQWVFAHVFLRSHVAGATGKIFLFEFGSKGVVGVLGGRTVTNYIDYIAKWFQEKWYTVDQNNIFSLVVRNRIFDGHFYLSRLCLILQRNGYFLEIGAGDGESESITLMLERERQWTGLLIEPDPIRYKTLVERQRLAKLLNACVKVIIFIWRYTFRP